jgi:hypothetical protein
VTGLLEVISGVPSPHSNPQGGRHRGE